MKNERLTEIGLPETVKLFVRQNLIPYNEKISFNCRNSGEKDIFIVIGFILDQYLQKNAELMRSPSKFTI